MIVRHIALKERRIVRDSRYFRSLVIALFIVMFAAVALGAARQASFERERVNAASVDREVWNGQGARNPHSAAHFSRYAFKPLPPLAAFDPGAVDFAGLAVWMEAHRRNPANFRYAESSGALSRFTTLSPAWVLQALVPLLIVLLLFSSYAGEREDGTLRQLIGSGVSTQAVFAGKLRAFATTLLWILAPLAGVVWLAIAVFGAGGPPPDQPLRLLLLLACYALYFFTFACVAVGLSALCATRRAAAVVLFAFWFFSVVLVPRLAADVAVTGTPQPDAFAVATDLRETGSRFWESDELRDAARQRAIKIYDVASEEELPINYDAYELQASEEFADPLFAEVYEKLDARYERQEATLGFFSVVSPRLALATLSAGLSGTDRLHHAAFTVDAEMHRRTIVRQMNDDMMLHAGEAGYEYKSDPAFWQSIADFDGATPAFGRFASEYAAAMGLLLAWAAIGFLFARAAVSRASLAEGLK